MPDGYPCVCHSITGYSGGGRKMIDSYENGKMHDMLAPMQYGLDQQHKHLKEMKAVTGLVNSPLFTPIVADYYNGMATTVTVYAEMLNDSSIYDIYGMFLEQYSSSALVSVLPLNGGTDKKVTMVPSNALADKDSMQIFISGNEERIFITSLFDNLGKGASGAAIQCMNISMGVDETKSLVI